MTTWSKWIAAGLLLTLCAFGGTAWWLHHHLDAMVRRGIAHYGSQMTQARVAVDAVQIRSADGSGVLRGLVIGNPAGFRTPHALRVNEVEIAVDVRTLADPVVVVRRIVIDAPDVTYEKGDAATNLEVIQRNIVRAIGTTTSPPRRLIVDEFVIRGARAEATAPGLGGRTVAATLPDITLRHVGRAQGGLTPAQLGDVVARALTQRVMASFAPDRMIRSVGQRVKGWFGP